MSGERYHDADINENLILGSTYFSSFIASLKRILTLFHKHLTFFKVIK
jgi:hypothetical protein